MECKMWEAVPPPMEGCASPRPPGILPRQRCVGTQMHEHGDMHKIASGTAQGRQHWRG